MAPGERDTAFAQPMYINSNKRTQSGRKFDRGLEVRHRDEFLTDGSKTNGALLASTKPYGAGEHEWRGAVVAVAMEGNDEAGMNTYTDVDLGHLRMIIDHTV